MSPNSSIRPLPELVPEQEFLTGYVSTVIGPIEFRVWKSRLDRINEILGLSEVEKTFQRLSLRRRDEDEQRASEKENRPFRPLSAGEQAGYQRLSSQALRCNVVQTLMGEDFRGFSCRLSESPLLQWFCKMDRLGEGKIPGKSALQRYSQGVPEGDMRKEVDRLPISVVGVAIAAMVLQNGPARRGENSGQERVAALQPVGAGSGYAEGDRQAAGGGGGKQG